MSKLTVLLTVYNGEAFLAETIESVLNQTYRDFIFLILDNASTDRSREIVKSYDDSRIQLEALPQNIGQAAALNKGLDMVTTDYVARIDADDICMPIRFEQQVEYLDNHPETGICGGYVIAFEGSREFFLEWPLNHDDIDVRLLFESCMPHPSVTMRMAFLNQHQLRYNEISGHSEDWELWQKAAKHMKLGNIPEVHLRYRLHANNESKKNSYLQDETAKRLDSWTLSFLHLEEHPLRQIHRDVSHATFNAHHRGPEFIEQVINWFEALETANQTDHVYNERSLHCFLKERLFYVLHFNTKFTGTVTKVFFKEKLHRYVGFLRSVKFFMKVILSIFGYHK